MVSRFEDKPASVAAGSPTFLSNAMTIRGLMMRIWMRGDEPPTEPVECTITVAEATALLAIADRLDRLSIHEHKIRDLVKGRVAAGYS